ncbi:MAG: (2Fe-2S)-binding protein [Anaerolineae bacterium]|nr:(2Fe-2S)-binding protein [Anaerolineae bacterium]
MALANGHYGAWSRIVSQAWVVEGSPLRGKTGVIWIEHHGHPHPFLQRGACCLSYKVPEYGYCSTCPLLSQEEREQRLRQHLIEHH